MRRALALAILAHLLLLSLVGAWLHGLPRGDDGAPAIEVALRHVGQAMQDFAQDARDSSGAGQAANKATTTASSSSPDTAATRHDSGEAAATRSGLPFAGDGPAIMAPIESPLDGLKRDYVMALTRHLLAQPPDYPRGAWKRGVEGTVIVSIRLDAVGNITDARVTGSSGDAELDAAALRHVRERSPLPRPPAELADAMREIWWDWPVPFRIE